MAVTPTFGIVIPTHNEEHNLARLLKSITSQTYTSYSVTVVDQGSTDKTADIAREYGCTFIEIPRPKFYTAPSRSRNIGASLAAGELLLHLDADMELGSSDFLARLRALVDADHQAVVIRELDVASGFWAECKALERSCYWGTTMVAARAVTRELFTRVGGYNEAISSGEDFYVTRLYERETRVGSDQTLLLRHYIGQPSLKTLLRKKFIYGKTADAYIARAQDIGAASASSIIWTSMRAYLKNWKVLGRQPVHCLGIFALRAMELLAVSLGRLNANYQGSDPDTSG